MQSNSQLYSGIECGFDTDDIPTSPTNNAENKLDPSKYKTKICRNFANGIPCPFEGRCVFAHGESQLRAGDPETMLATAAAAATTVRPLPPYSLAIQDAVAVPPPPPYTPYASIPSTPTSPTYCSAFPAMHQSHSSASLTRVDSTGSLSASSRPDTPPAYPTHFRHEPYSSGGFVFCEAPTRPMIVA